MKKDITLELDTDVVEWLNQSEEGVDERANKILRSIMEQHETFLEAALEQTREDIAAGRYTKESIEQHLKRIKSDNPDKNAWRSEKSWPCTITPDTPSGFFLQVVDIEEAFTRGETIEEALQPFYRRNGFSEPIGEGWMSLVTPAVER